MKHKSLLSFIFIAFCFSGFSQQGRAFAITGQGNGNLNWTDIRSIDMTSGNVSSVLFENGKTRFSYRDAETNNPIDQPSLKEIPIEGSRISKKEINLYHPSPTSLMSAAIAYDQKHGKLFFASMHTGKLVWLDMRADKATPVFYTIEKPLVENKNFNDEALNITRMTIGANGDGYALTNDANHFISFTTGKKTIIRDLGNLVDAESNKGISIHNQCSSWGGDLVADAFGKFYLFTASHLVFEIDPSRLATLKGSILNLPATFSVNGAAVDDNGNVIVSSANTLDGFYKVNIKDLSATKLETKGQIFNASDLASANLLNQAEANMESVQLPAINVIGNKFISIYPNPVNDGQIKISFDTYAAGEYEIALTDLQGRLIDHKTVSIKYRGQLENFKLRTKPAQGLYLIKVTDASSQKIFSDKLLIQ